MSFLLLQFQLRILAVQKDRVPTLQHLIHDPESNNPRHLLRNKGPAGTAAASEQNVRIGITGVHKETSNAR